MARSSTGRFRSMSGGSFGELSTTGSHSNNTTAPVNTNTYKGAIKTPRRQSTESTVTSTGGSPDAARHLLDILLQIRDPDGLALLHHITKDVSLLKAALGLLQRAEYLNMVDEFLLQSDFESGYSPLHTAVFEGSLSATLLLLRFPQERLLHRPMHLLTSEQSTVFQQKDGEGLTPFQLLSHCQITRLRHIRTSLPTPKVVTTDPSRSSNRRVGVASFAVQDPDDDTDEESPSLRPWSDLSDHNHWHQTGCEVMTFGAAHHPALGVSDTTKNAHQNNRPQRVQVFALGDRRDDSAIQIAAAAHHTIILSRRGHVYACGLGKGGRLGTTGQEQSTPVPLRVGGSLDYHRVTFVAAAENHSLCVTQEGTVFAWGSNRFGQLDASPSTATIRCLPTRVSDMKKPCIAVAAGDRHSVALTQQGEVYTWGDNAAGQLGRNRKSGIERVEALWTNGRLAIQVEASEQSTLVLIRPSGQGLPYNSVYTWGHGNPHPIKVTFDKGTRHQSDPFVGSIPIDIACAKNHSAAVTHDGRVYTFGMHAETLGSKQTPSLVVASPVTGMFPENGGGWAVSVSASDQYTAVVTSEGHLFTWGSTSDKNVMGHEGRRWQPSPKRVDGVHRAVSVAVAKEHTVLLIGTTFPQVPSLHADSSLASLAAKHVCNHVDMFNVIPILIMAERLHSNILQEYCQRFVRDNMDGVLTFARKSELDTYLNELLADRHVKPRRDGAIHPLVMQAIMMGKSTQEWLVSCQAILDHLPVSTLVRYRRRATRRAVSFHEHRHVEEEPQEKLQAGHQGCSERCIALTANLNSLEADDQIMAKYECLSKEIRGITKRLTQVSNLLGKTTVSSAEREKVNRKPLLEADLEQLRRGLERVQKMMSERNIAIKSIENVVQESESKLAPDDVEIAVDVTSFHCDICSVTCPNGNHLELHKSGRKHRNRVKQMEDEEKEQTANAILEEKRQQLFLASTTTSSPPMRRNPDVLSRKETVQPRYQLPPPQIPPGPQVVGKTIPNWASPIPVVKPKSLRSILAEEEKVKDATRQSQCSKKLLGSSQGLLSPGSVPPLRNAPWATAPVVSVSVGPGREVKQAPRTAAPSVGIPVAKTLVQPSTPNLPSASFVKQTPPSKVKRQSLGEFLNGPKVALPPAPVVAPWAATQPTAKKVPCSPISPLPKSKSLYQIQQEEEEFARRQSKHVAKEAKWFIGRVDRAESFSALQEIDAQEREMRLLIEEQFEIEKQIALAKKQKDTEKDDKTNARSRCRQNQRRPAGDKKDRAESKSSTVAMKPLQEPQSNRKQTQNKSRNSKCKGNNVSRTCPDVTSP